MRSGFDASEKLLHERVGRLENELASAHDEGVRLQHALL